MKPYVLLVRSLIHINLFFRIYEQKTQLVIENEGAKCRPTENFKIPSYYTTLTQKKSIR